MKTCIYCELTMKTQNFKKHLNACHFKKEFNLPKSDILKAISGYKPIEIQPSPDVGSQKYLEFIKEIFTKSSELVTNQSDLTIPELIDQMQLSPETKNEYKGEWGLYLKWCTEKNERPLNIVSANTYLAGSKLEISTIKNKRIRLQSIFKHVVGQSACLAKIRRRVKKIPKYPLSPQEIIAYLKEQKKINYEDYVVQLIMCTYACRINACSGLKLKHLEFLENGDLMFLPDSKTGTMEVKVNQEIRDILTMYVDKYDITDPEEFLFHVGKSENLRRRSSYLCSRINKRIQASKVLKKSQNFKYSSHMFRKSKAFTLYREYMEKGKSAARALLGHKENSSSINYYI